MTVLVIDYKMGNLGSVRRSLEECGAEVLVSDNPKDIHFATHVVLPGVGAFADGMKNLEGERWIPAMKEVVADGVPFLGICLGMQLLAEKGYEGGETEGLGFIPGEVKRLHSESSERIPHVGWNEVHAMHASPLFESVSSGTDFYFVHSYHFIPSEDSVVAGRTPYCGGFVSAVARKNVYGVQFHPEKSSRPGFQLLKNFLRAYKNA